MNWILALSIWCCAEWHTVATTQLNDDSDALLLISKENAMRMGLNTFQKDQLFHESSSIDSFDFDIEHNCIYYVSSEEYTQIKRRCLNGNGIGTAEIVYTNPTSDAFKQVWYDWTTELLFLMSSNHIEAVGTSSNRSDFHRVLVFRELNYLLYDMAIHPRKGYLFFSSYCNLQGRIYRTNMDGSDSHILKNYVNSEYYATFTIDYEKSRIYWMIGSVLASCDFDGSHCNEHMSCAYFPQVESFVVRDNYVYWSDANREKLLRARLESSFVDLDLLENFHAVLDGYHEGLRLSSNLTQSAIMNACSRGLHNCSQVCVAMPDGGHSCLCSDGMEKTDDGKCFCPGSHTPLDDGSCPEVHNQCSRGKFECISHECVPDFVRCDGDADCSDGSDERHCTPCPSHLKRCDADGRCISE